MAEDKADRFPEHWGSPPEIQTDDWVKLPANYCFGSSTLATWIEEKMAEDKADRFPEHWGSPPEIQLTDWV
jgi:hypothetical protein